MTRSTARPRVLIVGAGLAGTATAIRLLCFARRPLEIVLLERRADYRHAGVAYHRAGNPWDHVFNIQAGRMSVFREDVFDFIRWANREADRRDWPAPWADFEFTEAGPAPRRLLQDYLTARLAEARREAYDGVVLAEADGEAIDLRVHAAGVAVTVRDLSPSRLGAQRSGQTVELSADHVILATGLELRQPSFAAAVADHPSYLRNPYSAEAVRKLEELPAQAAVAIVGTLLSAYDSAAFLLRRGHTGPIRLISASGTLLRTYPRDHEHGVVELPCPTPLMEPYLDREEFLGRLLAAWRGACDQVAREHPRIDPEVIAERVTKAWEPYLPAAIERIPAAELRALLTEYSTLIAALRVSAVVYSMSVIERALRAEDGPAELVVGKVERITPADSGRLLVSVGAPGPQRIIEADLVVSNFGREADYARVGHPLWTGLVRIGLAVPHRRTGRGIEVDEHGTLLGADAGPIRPVSAVGVLREGDEIVRNGRSGAFAFNLAAIKNQSITAAAFALERLELLEDEAAEGPAGCPGDIGNLEQAGRAEFEEAVVLEVRRMTTRMRAEREKLGSLLDEHVGSMAASRTRTARVARPDRLVRAAVTRAAVVRLTDVSVTPRQLRRRLGLVSADDPEV
jgi:uncharacterized NAD(P)/FAD-binding protein YdhS